MAEKTQEEILLDKIKSQVNDLMESKTKASAETLTALDTQIKSFGDKIKGLENYDALKAEHIELMSFMKAAKEKPTVEEAKESIRELLQKNAENLKNLKSKKVNGFTIEIKAQQNPTDIGTRTDYATFLPGTTRKPVRRTFMRDIFKTIPVGTEYVKYREEDTVTRDAKVVIACATSTHNTKKSWVTTTVQIQKVRDMVDICLDMLDDYDFVAAEINQLVDESVKLKGDSEIFNGTGTILSVDQISSEFVPNNALADFTGAKGFQAPTLAELTAAMKAQIYVFGSQNAWDADIILMNYGDWVRFQHLKNTQNEYLLPNFVLTNGGLLNGMQIVTNPLVAPNTLYVFDSTKGVILDRKAVTIEMSYENKDNFEHEVVTVKALERFQFNVKNIERNAFMKCSDILSALTAITKA